jgi:hypothetical protein
MDVNKTLEIGETLLVVAKAAAEAVRNMYVCIFLYTQMKTTVTSKASQDTMST